MHKQALRSLYFLVSLLICGQGYAHVLAEKPASSIDEIVIKDKLQESGFVILPKELVIKKLKDHNVFFEDSVKLNELSLQDVNSVLAAIYILPEHLNIMYPKVILSIDLHNLKSETAYYDFFITYTSSSYGRISLSKNWSNHSFEKKVGTVLHELGHHFNYVLGDFHYSDFWKNIDGGWESIDSISKPNFPEKQASLYAESSPSEDWAESFVLYVLDPSKLKDISFNKFEFIDRLFSDDLDKYEFIKFKKLLKPYMASREKSGIIPLYRDCLSLIKVQDHKFCSSLSLVMLNSRSIQNTLDTPSDNQSSLALSLFLKKFNQYIKP